MTRIRWKPSAKKAKDLIEGDKKAIEENAATARNPKNAPYQRQWAEARLKGNFEGKIRHEQQLSETEDRLKNLSNESQDGQTTGACLQARY